MWHRWKLAADAIRFGLLYWHDRHEKKWEEMMPRFTRLLRQTDAHLHESISRLRARRAQRVLRQRAIEATAAHDAWWAEDRRWYPGGTPPRRHNRVIPLIDGANYFAALHLAIMQAKHSIYISGWSLTPYIPLLRHDDGALVTSRLLDLLATAAGRIPVRILLWDGAPLLLQPTTQTAMTARDACVTAAKGGDLRCELDHTAHLNRCHHQKVVVVDGRVAFVGGIDLTTLGGDRWDTRDHPLRHGPNWHDVQLQIEGEAVADVGRSFRQRWHAVAGEALPEEQPTVNPEWSMPVQIVRTIDRGIYPFAPQGEFGIYHAYLQAIRQARRLIYLENQYLWSPDLVDALIAAMNRADAAPLRIIIVLPAHASSGRWDNNHHVLRLREADAGRGIVSVYSLYASGPGRGVRPFTYRPIYVHAKVAVIDDEWCTIGSANLNNRGFVLDSQVNALIRDPTVARNLRFDLWAEHLKMPREQIADADPIVFADTEWPRRATENAAIIREGERPLVAAVHRYEVGHEPGTWLLEEVETLTFDH